MASSVSYIAVEKFWHSSLKYYLGSLRFAGICLFTALLTSSRSVSVRVRLGLLIIFCPNIFFHIYHLLAKI